MRKQLEITDKLDHETDMVSFGGGGGGGRGKGGKGHKRRKGGGGKQRANKNMTWDDMLRRQGKELAITGGSTAGAGFALTHQEGKAATGAIVVMTGTAVSGGGLLMMVVGFVGGLIDWLF